MPTKLTAAQITAAESATPRRTRKTIAQTLITAATGEVAPDTAALTTTAVVRTARRSRTPKTTGLEVLLPQVPLPPTNTPEPQIQPDNILDRVVNPSEDAMILQAPTTTVKGRGRPKGVKNRTDEQKTAALLERAEHLRVGEIYAGLDTHGNPVYRAKLKRGRPLGSVSTNHKPREDKSLVRHFSCDICGKLRDFNNNAFTADDIVNALNEEGFRYVHYTQDECSTLLGTTTNEEGSDLFACEPCVLQSGANNVQPSYS